MRETIWAQARRRAFAETLELIRLDSLPRALLTLGVPAATLSALWFVTGALLPATAITVAATLIIGLLIFLAKLVTTPARLAEEATALLAAQASQKDNEEAARRRSVIAKLVALYTEVRGDDVAPAIRAGLELPPEDWLNEHLSEFGESWQVFNTVGTGYQTFEIVSGDWRYRGQQMSSPQAIKWASFFDALHVAWKVGKDHWEIDPNGAPDFYLPQLDAWFVIELSGSEGLADYCNDVASVTGKSVLLARGEPAFAKENLWLFGEGQEFENKALAWGEDRRDKGVYWLLKTDGTAAVRLGGPGRSTEHGRLPIISDVIKAAMDAAKKQSTG